MLSAVTAPPRRLRERPHVEQGPSEGPRTVRYAIAQARRGQVDIQANDELVRAPFCGALTIALVIEVIKQSYKLFDVLEDYTNQASALFVSRSLSCPTPSHRIRPDRDYKSRYTFVPRQKLRVVKVTRRHVAAKHLLSR